MRLFREKKLVATIPTASMADIAFLLIIFFMLTTSFSPVKTSVDLPESVDRAEVEQNAAIVAVTTQDEIVFSDGDNPGFNVDKAEDLGSAHPKCCDRRSQQAIRHQGRPRSQVFGDRRRAGSAQAQRCSQYRAADGAEAPEREVRTL